MVAVDDANVVILSYCALPFSVKDDSVDGTVDALTALGLPVQEASQVSEALAALKRAVDQDARALLLDTLSESFRLYFHRTLVFATALLTIRSLSFGDYLEFYSDHLYRRSFKDQAVLSKYLALQGQLLKELFSAQDPSSLRVFRARLLGITNLFETHLAHSCYQNCAVLLRVLCHQLIPMQFQGICNRGLKDAPGRHFELCLRSAAEENLDATREEGETADGKNEDVAEPFPAKLAGRQAAGKRKRAEPEGADSQASSVTSSAPNGTFLVDLHPKWPQIEQLLHNPISYMSRETVGRTLELVQSLLQLLHHLRHTSVHSPHSSAKKKVSILDESHFRLLPPECKLPPPSFSVSEDVLMENRHPASPGGSRTWMSSENAQPQRTYPWKKELDHSLATYDAPMEIQAFLLVASTDMFRRYLAMRISIMLRSLFFRRKKNPAAIELVPAPLAAAFKDLSDSVYRLQKQIPSCSNDPFPTLSHRHVPWFCKPSSWFYPAMLSSLVAEFDSQEVMMTMWKAEGCNELGCPPWTAQDQAQVKVDLGRDPASAAPGIFSHVSVQPDNWVTGFFSNAQHDAFMEERHKKFRDQFLPIVREYCCDRAAHQAPESHWANLSRPVFSREREAWYLPPTDDIADDHATVSRKLERKWHDYVAKVYSDEDARNEIDQDEKIVKDNLFQWRCHRLLNLTNLDLYDYNTQDKELRFKIKEASIGNLIDAVMQKDNGPNRTNMTE